jgi:hypothetical protein
MPRVGSPSTAKSERGFTHPLIRGSLKTNVLLAFKKTEVDCAYNLKAGPSSIPE